MATSPNRDTPTDQRSLAVLIDADNAQAAVIEGLLAEVAKYGTATVRRIYGDFTSQRLSQWKQVLLKHSIHPVQQFAYTQGKNATDSSLIIDAMDLMYTGRFDAFCLVSSDSDFTRLAQRLREQGLTVYGFGEKKTPDPFVQACDKFIYTEVLRAEAQSATAESEPAPARVRTSAKRSSPRKSAAESAPEATRVGTARSSGNSPPLALIHQAIEEADDENGWAFLGTVGNYLSKVRPDFDTRLYGHKKLSDLIRAWPKHFALEERGADSGNPSIHVRSLKTRA